MSTADDLWAKGYLPFTWTEYERQKVRALQERIEELVAEAKVTNQNAEAFNQQNQRLAHIIEKQREAIESAPHEPTCNLRDIGPPNKCTCWKRKALEGEISR